MKELNSYVSHNKPTVCFFICEISETEVYYIFQDPYVKTHYVGYRIYPTMENTKGSKTFCGDYYEVVNALSAHKNYMDTKLYVEASTPKIQEEEPNDES